MSLHYHETNLTKGYLASVVKSQGNQLFNQYLNKYDNCLQGASHRKEHMIRESSIHKARCRQKFLKFPIKNKFHSTGNVTTIRQQYNHQSCDTWEICLRASIEILK